MLKRIGCISLVIVLCIYTLCGCEKNMKFDSQEEMKSYVNGVWESDYAVYLITDGTVVRYSDYFFNTFWSEFSQNTEYDINNLSSEEFYIEYLSRVKPINIEYDYSNSKIKYNGMDYLTFLDDGTAIESQENVFHKSSKTNSYIADKVKEFYNEKVFEQKYPDLPTAREVQYDKWGHFGDNFIIEGTAELDDYYNYGYKNYEYGYFCINIRPSGGTYSDEWYVYANRKTFSDLYESLQGGSKSVTLVAELIYVDTGSNNMATLVDYKN